MRGGASRGFTVIEVMIVLAVSGALFISAVIMISGRQSQTAFQEAARQIQSQIQQVLNDVSTGYYPNNANFACSAVSSTQPPTLAAAASGQGTNSGCIFVGKVIQFKVGSSDPEQFTIYTITGLKKGAVGGGESTSLADTRPILVAPGTAQASIPNYPDNSDDQRLQNGLTVNRMWYRDAAGTDHDTGAVAFVNSFAGSGNLLSGSGHVDVVAADNSANTTALGSSKAAMVQALNSSGDNRLVTAASQGGVNPTKGVYICFDGGLQDYAVLQIGGEDRDLSMTLHIIDKTGATCTYP